ncbi:serine hydrolase, partial [Klebsiella pneumoniae]|nr:serine hydrolase [Klebsiella pneumoniae]
ISTLDHARFGLLISRGGKWGEKQLISEQWIREATKQQGVKSDYGYLWWLNNEGRWPDAPRSSFSAQGAGDNTIWID